MHACCVLAGFGHFLATCRTSSRRCQQATTWPLGSSQRHCAIQSDAGCRLSAGCRRCRRYSGCARAAGLASGAWLLQESLALLHPLVPDYSHGQSPSPAAQRSASQPASSNWRVPLPSSSSRPQLRRQRSGNSGRQATVSRAQAAAPLAAVQGWP
eukprot:COSAG03_NODE_2438_length_2767_cov_3.164543_2_plen_155_part_00